MEGRGSPAVPLSLGCAAWPSRRSAWTALRARREQVAAEPAASSGSVAAGPRDPLSASYPHQTPPCTGWRSAWCCGALSASLSRRIELGMLALDALPERLDNTGGL